MDRQSFLSELKKLDLLDLLEVYFEAKAGRYKSLYDDLSPETLDSIKELEQELTSLI
jgi:hypothetical protein